MPAVICNTSALQYLHQIDHLDLLPARFEQEFGDAPVRNSNCTLQQRLHARLNAEQWWVFQDMLDRPSTEKLCLTQLLAAKSVLE